MYIRTDMHARAGQIFFQFPSPSFPQKDFVGYKIVEDTCPSYYALGLNLRSHVAAKQASYHATTLGIYLIDRGVVRSWHKTE